MNFDILGMINEAVKEANAFDAHPMCDVSLEERLLYLQGLGLIMHSDGNIGSDEVEYLHILIKSFGMDKSTIDCFISFAEQPDKDTIQAFFQTFSDSKYASVFILDALMIAHTDGNFDHKEKTVIEKMCENLNITAGLKSDIFCFHECIQTGNLDSATVYFNSDHFPPELYQYIFEYYNVDLNEIVNNAKNSRRIYLKQSITKEFTSEKINWGVFTYGDDDVSFEVSAISYKETEITKTLVKPTITYAMISPYLQIMFDRGEFEYDKQDNALIYNRNIIFDLKKHPVVFDSINRSFQLSSTSSINERVKDLTKSFYIKFIDSPLVEDCSDFELFSDICDALYGGKPACAKTVNGSRDYMVDFLVYPHCDGVAIDNCLYQKDNKEGIFFGNGSMCFGVDRTIEEYDKSMGSCNFEHLRTKTTEWSKASHGASRSEDRYNENDWMGATMKLGKHKDISWNWINKSLSLEELLDTGCYLIR